MAAQCEVEEVWTHVHSCDRAPLFGGDWPVGLHACCARRFGMRRRSWQTSAGTPARLVCQISARTPDMDP